MEEKESRLFGVSLRGWLALIMVLTVCVMSFLKIEVSEPLKSMVTVAIGFYWGQRGVK